MKLPHADRALVERKKIQEYLLNRERPDNGGKENFFARLGFSGEDWITFAGALCLLARRSELTASMESGHGTKYIVDGPIETPGRVRTLVRTVWILDTGETIPRLVTAYAHEE